MPVNLTPNAIAAVNGGDVNSKPLVQVLDIKLTGSTQERYRLLISDSAASQHVMLATQLSDRVKTGAVKKGSVVQLIDYICSTVQNYKIIVVLNLETILLDCEITGNPKMFAESESVPAGPHESEACRPPVAEAGPENVTPLPGAVLEATMISSNSSNSSRPGASSGVPSGTFVPCKILEAMASGRAYVGEDIWSRLRVGDFSQRLNNFYNSSVYMVSELADVLKTNRAQAETIIRLEDSLKESEERRLSLERACKEKLGVNQETVDSHLAARLETKQRASVAKENARSTRDLLSAARELMLQAEQKAEEARLSYE